ncbi:MAG: ribosome biogenesis protein [Candidatus Aenigmarchaeota archaeon]|nr:ribosome biogenesis protein [Candidatus Aenigmarchaeota archaeon]
MFKCSACGKYILIQCTCGGKAVPAEPPKFSAADKYGKYRRMAKSFNYAKNQ